MPRQPDHFLDAPTHGTCAACARPFDPEDSRHDGHAQYGVTPHCLRCVDRCHESTDAFHTCAVCRTE